MEKEPNPKGPNLNEGQEEFTFEMPTFVSKTIEIDGENFVVQLAPEKEQLVFIEGKVESALLKKLHKFVVIGKEWKESFRIQLETDGVSILVAFLMTQKKIIILSTGARKELFLFSELEKISSELTEEQNKLLIEYKLIIQNVLKLKTSHFPTSIEYRTAYYQLPDLFKDKKYLDLEDMVANKTKKLAKVIGNYSPSLFERLSDYGLSLTAKFIVLRIHLLKFLAILPSLDHDIKGVEVKRILLETCRRIKDDSIKKSKEKNSTLPFWIFSSVVIVHFVAKFIPSKILAFIVRQKVRFMAKRFIAGESIETSNKVLQSLHLSGRQATLDQLGELVVSEEEADHYCEKVIELINGFSLHVNPGEKNSAGIEKAHISIKVSALSSQFNPLSLETTYESVAPRLIKILTEAKKNKVFINIDAEHYHYRDLVFEIYKKVLLETKELFDFESTGIVVQAYLRDGFEHLLEVIELAKSRQIRMPIRLVKGAYWDAETIEADVHGFDAPQFLNKEETDIYYRQLIIKILENSNDLQLCLGSHNMSDHCFSEVIREKLFPKAPIIEHQCLHMTYEGLSVGMTKMDWAVRNYVPIGSLLVGMAYLVRRIMENSSQVGILSIMRSHKNLTKVVSPVEVHKDKKNQGKMVRDRSVQSLRSDFFNVTPIREYLKSDFQSIQLAKTSYENNNLGEDFKNSFSLTGKKVDILCSSDPSIVVGRIAFASSGEGDLAVKRSLLAYEKSGWPKSLPIMRANILLKAAEIMLSKRNKLSQHISFEAGKTILESYADVDEAIDFLNFYAREELRINDNNKLASRGVVAVISPWNFPLAIPCGMVASALVAGNSVILKSAEQTPLITQILVDIFHEAGLPKDLLIHLPGEGEIVGRELVENQNVAEIIFTGSRAVGEKILETAAHRVYENKVFDYCAPTKVITEMGGKNAIIVTANAELDETIEGIIYSAFGHAGQKCSACSRIIIDESIKKAFIERFEKACRDIVVGKSFQFETFINPLVSMEDKKRVIDTAKKAGAEAKEFGGKVVINRSEEKLPGYCVGPVVVELPYSRALKEESYSQKEIFGPFVHIVSFSGLDQAVEIFNSTDYALTGGVFSQSQDDIDYLIARIKAGNIYVNRSCTGARVAIEPFGGFKHSGTGPKAGGKNYLSSHHVSIAKVKEENVQREKGSDYQFDLLRPIDLPESIRLKRVDRILGKLIQNFESLYGQVNEKYKHKLLLFKKWLQFHYKNYIYTDHPNHTIPGQLSYDNFQLTRKRGVLISSREMPSLQTLLYMFSALSTGAGVTVICLNSYSFRTWSSFIAIVDQVGISKDSFDVFTTNDENLEKILTDIDLEYAILDTDSLEVEKINKTIFSHLDERRIIPEVMTTFDAPATNKFKRYMKKFILIRSMAINTMRHGAPLEL